MKRFSLFLISLLLVLGACKKENIDSTANSDLSWDGDVVTIPFSPVSNPHSMEMWGFAVKKNELDAFSRQLASNQYTFKDTKDRTEESYERTWKALFKKYLVVMYAKNHYSGQKIMFNINNGIIQMGAQPVRTFKLDYIFQQERGIPVGSGVATMLNAKVGQEYQMVWLLVSHGGDDDHSFSAITYLNSEPAIQTRSLYTIAPAIDYGQDSTNSRVVRSS